MDSPTVVSSSSRHAILIVDKHNFLGEKIISRISPEIACVLVSDKSPEASSNTIHIKSKIAPQIPNAQYTHMVFVWEKEITDWLHPVLLKAAQLQAKVLVIADHNKLHELGNIERVKEVASLLIVGDVFGGEVNEYPLDRWIKKTKETKKIILHNMGLTTWYPVLYKDVVEVATKTLFSNIKKGDIFFASSQHIYTSLSLTHALQKIDPYIQIDLQTTGEDSSKPLPMGEYLLDSTYPALEKIKKRYEQIVVTTKHEEKKSFFPTPPERQYITHLHKKVHVSFFVYGLLVFLLMPVIIFAGSGAGGLYMLHKSVKDLEAGKSSKALQEVNSSQQLFGISLTSSQVVSAESSILGQQGAVNSFTTQLSTAKTVSNGLEESIVTYQKLLWVFTGKTLTPNGDVTSAVNTMKAAIQTFQSIQDSSIPSSYKPQFNTYKEGLDNISAFTDVVPGIIGANGDRTYAILFQNNMELRPGGGFIGSYGLLKLHNGKFAGFTIHDVYDSDGQLKGHVEPPFAIRRYIPIVHLFLRDSNFDIDNSRNAKIEAQLLNQETGEKVDGIVAVDLSFVKTLLSITVKVYVPSYNQTVTPNNFFLLTEQHAEKNTFAGSSQKKDFLNSLFNAVLEKIQSNGIAFSKNTLNAFLDSLNEKHVLITFADQTIQEPFTYAGYSSSLWDNRVDNPQVVSDFLGINDANLGINKANYFVKRSVSQKVLVDAGGNVQEAVTATYVNNSKVNVWPGGDYKNYVRFILPLNTILQEVTINGTPQKIVPAVTDPKIYEGNFTPPKGLEVEKYDEQGKTVYGFLIFVPAGNSMTVGLAYQLTDKVSLASETVNYSLKLFKQPGVDDMPYQLDVAYPKTFSLVPGTREFTSLNGVIELKKDVVTDEEVDIPFAASNK